MDLMQNAALGKDAVFALCVALVTWLGIFAYLVRLEILTRALEKTVTQNETHSSQTSTPAPLP